MGRCGWQLLPYSSWDHYGDQKKGHQHLKKKRDSPSRRSLREILQQGAGSSGAPLRGPVATSEPTVEISAKGKNEPAVRNLPEVKPRTLLLEVSSTDNQLQGASTSSIPTAEEVLEHLVSGAGGLHLAKKTCFRQKMKKAKTRASEAGTAGTQQP
jgi:hypothetical protein